MGQESGWWRLFVSRKETRRTTWPCRLVILMFAVVICSSTRGLWIPAIAQSLVCTEEAGPSDAILVENFDPDYLVFERAATLQQAGFSARVLVPVEASRADPQEASAVDRGIAELIARVARVRNPEILPIRHDTEPISLNSAVEIRDFLARAHLGSVIVVAPAFRSRRSSLVYRTVLTPAGIRVYCAPVFGQHTLRNWTATWHGIQDVTLQFIKLQFYRLAVLPRAVRKP
jgi:hypothetical protein